MAEKTPSMIEVPDQVLAPKGKVVIDGVEKRYDARPVDVLGTAVWDNCPGCNRVGPVEGYLLTPDEWPNMVAVCGEKGCGVFWGLIGSPPQKHKWLR